MKDRYSFAEITLATAAAKFANAQNNRLLLLIRRL